MEFHKDLKGKKDIKFFLVVGHLDSYFGNGESYNKYPYLGKLQIGIFMRNSIVKTAYKSQ